MAESVLCLAARGIIRDATTNSVSIFNLMEEVVAQGLPVFIPEMAVLGLWRKEGDETRIECEFIARIGETILHQIPTAISFEPNSSMYRAIVNIVGTVVNSPGSLTFEFRIGGRVSGSYTVRVLPPPSATTVQG
jgi:hypothetical protein